MAYRNIGDKSRHKQYSTVRNLHVVPFGFAFSSAGALLATGNANPPQVFATAGGSNQEYVLTCPKGHPDKIWAQMWTEGGIVASVSDFSTIPNGTLTIDLDTAPLADTILQGFLFYGGVTSEKKGVVSAAPAEPRQLKSYGQHCTDSLLKQFMFLPVGWTTDVSGDVTETRGPLGTTVAHSGVGEYTITFSHVTPPEFEENWAKIQGNSVGRVGEVAYSTTGNETSVVVTFSADMGDGERSSVIFGGSASHYPANYGGASGGVHSNLVARHIHNYRNYEQLGLIRGGVAIPFHATIATGTTGPVEATSNLPPSMRITRTGAGVYALYVGKLVSGGLIAEDVKLASGTAIGITAVNEATGVITITAPGGDPGADSLTGMLFLKHQTEP